MRGCLSGLGSRFSVLGSRPSTETREPRTDSAFTFIELLIVATIFSLLSIALYATFASGMRVWGRVQDTTFTQKRVILRAEKIAQDLRQIFNFPKIGFVAEEDSISIPTRSYKNEILITTYYFEDGGLFQKEEHFKNPQIGEDEGGEEEKAHDVVVRKLLSGVKELKFEFAHQGISMDEYEWKSSWKKSDGLPAAVKITIKVKDVQYIKSAVIPIS